MSVTFYLSFDTKITLNLVFGVKLSRSCHIQVFNATLIWASVHNDTYLICISNTLVYHKFQCTTLLYTYN